MHEVALDLLILLGLLDSTGCTVVAVERDGELIMDFSPAFVLAAMDTLSVCSTAGAFARFDEAFAEASA